MPDMRDDCETQRLRIEFLRRCRTSDATGMLLTGPCGNTRGFVRWTAGIKRLELLGNSGSKFPIFDFAAGCGALALPRTALLVCETLGFRAFDGFPRHEN